MPDAKRIPRFVNLNTTPVNIPVNGGFMTVHPWTERNSKIVNAVFEVEGEQFAHLTKSGRGPLFPHPDDVKSPAAAVAAAPVDPVPPVAPAPVGEGGKGTTDPAGDDTAPGGDGGTDTLAGGSGEGDDGGAGDDEGDQGEGEESRSDDGGDQDDGEKADGPGDPQGIPVEETGDGTPAATPTPQQQANARPKGRPGNIRNVLGARSRNR